MALRAVEHAAGRILKAGLALLRATARVASYLPAPYGAARTVVYILFPTGVGRNIRRDLIKTPSRRHFESKRTSKTGSTSKIGSRNGFVRFGNFCIFRSLSPHGVLNSGHKLTVTYYGEITIEPILNPEFDVDHDFEVKNGCFQSLFPRFRVISAYSTGRASHSDHFSGQVSMATILQDFYLFRRGFQHCTRDHLPDEG